MASRDGFTVLIGNVTRDPELKYGSTGTAYTNIGMALNDRVFDKESEQWKDREGVGQFMDVTAFGSTAENFCTSVKKGARIIVVCRPQYRQWNVLDSAGNPTEEKRSKVEFIADGVGVDLRWATVTIEKNEKRTPGDVAPAIDPTENF